MCMADLTRKTLNFTDRAVTSMNRIREVDGYNETDTVNRAVILNAALLDYMKDGTLTVLDQNGETVRLVLI